MFATSRFSRNRSTPIPILRTIWIWMILRPWLALPILALPAFWTFVTDGVRWSQDISAHLTRVAALDYNISHGALYPRWMPEFNLGGGYPILGFYGPLSYYLVECLHLFGLSYPAAFAGALCLFVLLGGLGMYLLAIDVFNQQQKVAAVVAATAYMYTPYLLTNVYVRGALGEIGAMALLPWIFWSFRRLLRADHPDRYVMPAILSLAALAVTHNITLLLAPPILLCYMAIVARSRGPMRSGRTKWCLLAIVGAMGISAFFWLPMTLERAYLSDYLYREAVRVQIAGHAWHWNDFLDPHLLFYYTMAPPFKLGLVQLALAIAGLILARRHDMEWLFLAGAAICLSLFAGAWAAPLWLSNAILPTVQFPWRILSVVSLLLALLAGGCLLSIRRGTWRMAAGIALITLIVVAQRPTISSTRLPAEYDRLTPALLAHNEFSHGGMAQGDRDFRPLWAMDTIYQPAADIPVSPFRSVMIQRGNAFGLEAEVVSTQGGPLRFTNLYFPSWHALLDGQTPLVPYASTNLGLLTIDVPAGQHHISVYVSDTPLEAWAERLSGLSLVALVVFCVRRKQQRLAAAIPLLLLICGTTASIFAAPTDSVQTPLTHVEGDHVRLLGYRSEQYDSGSLYIYPYWYAEAQPAELWVHWLVKDTAGHVLAETVAPPYFNSSTSTNWPAATLVDDAYEIRLPPGMAPGRYELALQLETDMGLLNPSPIDVGPVVVRSSPPPLLRPPGPSYALNTRFGNVATLLGYDLTRNSVAPGQKMIVVHPHTSVRYDLYWQSGERSHINYNSYLHLVGADGNTLAMNDQVQGAPFCPTSAWDQYTLCVEHTIAIISPTATSGLYKAQVGVYVSETMKLLPVIGDAGQEAGTDAYLMPVKVVDDRVRVPQNPMAVQIGDFATLIGYDITSSPPDVTPGGLLRLTFYYRSTHSTSVDYTRFVHLYEPGGKLLAGSDGVPQAGANPTSAWVPDEVVADTVNMSIPDDVHPGTPLRIAIGFYDPQDSSARVLLQQPGGQPLPDNAAIVTEILTKAR
jgi:hypothetical protein